MDCSSITDFQQSTAIRIAKKFRNLHIGQSSAQKIKYPIIHVIFSSCLYFEADQLDQDLKSESIGLHL